MQKLALTSRDLVSCKVEVTPSSLPSTLPDPPFWCFVRRSWFQGREERRGEGVKNVEGRPVLLVGRKGEARKGRWSVEGGRSGTSPAGERRRWAWRGEGGRAARMGEGGRGGGWRGGGGKNGGRVAPACKGKVSVSNELLLLACGRKERINR